MRKPLKSDYYFIKVDWLINLVFGLLTTIVGGIAGFLVAGIFYGLPRNPFDVIPIWCVIAPAIVGYFVPIICDIIITYNANSDRRKRYFRDLKRWESYEKEAKEECDRLERSRTLQFIREVRNAKTR